jgi:hypothetical protein
MRLQGYEFAIIAVIGVGNIVPSKLDANGHFLIESITSMRYHSARNLLAIGTQAGSVLLFNTSDDGKSAL